MKPFIGLAGIAAIATLIAVPANAADMSPPPPAYKAPLPPAPTWTGCYIDGGVGYGMWNQDHSVTNPAGVTTVTTTDGGRGWLGRVGGGCDYQFPISGFGNFVIGAFADYDFMGINGSNTPNEFLTVGGITSPVTSNMHETDAWYAGGRIGYLPYPDLMAFFSGGWTGTRFTNSPQFLTFNGVADGFTYPGAFTVNGWFLGGGYEYRVPWAWASGLYWRTEYRFAEYNKIDLAESSVTTGVLTGNVQHNQSFVQTVTTGLVWKLNWAAPGAHW
jgi:outer membrane immunogenic protein